MRKLVATLLVAGLCAAGTVLAPPAVADQFGGPLILMGIDAEDGGPGGHGPISTYASVVGDLLANTQNAGAGILVIGGGKNAGDHVTSFWNAISSATGSPVTFVNGAAIGSQSFAGFKAIAIVSSVFQTGSGGLTDSENTALATREQDLVDFVNFGGGLIGFSQDGLSVPYDYLDGLGTFTTNTGRSYSAVTPTAEGLALGIAPADLDVCCWHDEYLTFPSFLNVLVTNDATGNPAAIGGVRVLLARQCAADVMTASITRPQAGRVYVEDADSGPSGSADAVVRGSSLTVTVQTSAPAQTAEVVFFVDAVPFATVTTGPPWTAVLNTAALSPGPHSIGFRALHTSPCVVFGETDIRVPDPAVAANATGVTVRTNVPVEPAVIAGGASVGPGGGSDFVRIAQTALAPALDHAHGITDSASGSTSGDLTAAAESQIADVSLLGGLITADVLHARAAASLDVETLTPSASGAGSVVADLRVAGVPVGVSAPNTVVPLPGGIGSVVVQETIPAGPPLGAEVTVNMLHVFLDTGVFAGEIVVASAHAGVNLLDDAFTGPADDVIHRDDDADSRSDAAENEAAALPIQPGTFSGSFSRGDQSDFYAFDTLQGERIVAVAKPAERRIVTVRPLPASPTVTIQTPDVELYLRDPGGSIRASSALGPLQGVSPPERVELNADRPYSPPGLRGRWTLEVRRSAGSPDGYYTLELALPPNPLREQNDAGQPGDAPDVCAAARPLTGLTGGEIDDYPITGVIRDADVSDFYSFEASIGQVIGAVLKPDEGGDGADLDLHLYGPAFPGGPANCSAPISSSELGRSIAKALPEAIAKLPATMSGTYVLEVRRYNAVANYYATVDVVNSIPTLPNNDAGSGADAADSCPAAAPSLGNGVFEGRLADTPTADVEDWYVASLASGEDLTVVLKADVGSDLDLTLYDQACVQVPPDSLTTSGPGAETAHRSNAVPGDYRLRVRRASGGGNYILGVIRTP